MKLFSLFFTVIFCSSLANAQSYESTIQYDKKKQTAITIDYPYPAEAVENAFVQRMDKLGFKAKEEKGILNRDKGFIVFKNAYITDISKDRMDYVIKVERKSRRDADESVLYLIMLKDGNNALSKMEAYDVGNAKNYVNTMLPDIEAANLELQINTQAEVVAKAEKKLRNLQEEKANLERKLSDNIKQQDDTIKDIDLQKQSLEELQSRRKK